MAPSRSTPLAWIAAAALALAAPGHAAADDPPDSYAGKSASWWITQLRDSRTEPVAVEALVRIGAPALPEVIAALAGTEPSVKRGAARALDRVPGALGPHAATLRRIARDEIVEVRWAALRAGARDPEVAKVMVEDLRTLLASGDPATRSLAVDIARAAGPSAAVAVDVLAMVLGEGRSDVQEKAADVLRRLGREAAPAVPSLRQIVRDPESAMAAIGVLATIGLAEPGVVEALRAAFDAKLPRTRAQVLVVLARGAGAGRAVDIALSGFRDADPEVRIAAINAFLNAELRTPETIDALVRAMDDGDRRVREQARSTIGNIGGDVSRVYDAVLRAYLASPENENLRAAAGSIVFHGMPSIADAYERADAAGRARLWPLASRVSRLTFQPVRNRFAGIWAREYAEEGADASRIPRMFDLLLEEPLPEPDELSAFAKSVLRHEFGPARGPWAGKAAGSWPMRAAMAKAIPQGDRTTRLNALALLANVVSWPRPAEEMTAIPPLLDDADPSVRRSAARALVGVPFESPQERSLEGRWGPPLPATVDRRKLVERLAEGLVDPEPFDRATSAFALGLIRPDSVVALDALFARFEDPDGEVAYDAARAVGFLAADGISKARDGALSRLDAKEPAVRAAAALALLISGTEASRVVPALEAAFATEQGPARRIALQALDRSTDAFDRLRPRVEALARGTDADIAKAANAALVRKEGK